MFLIKTLEKNPINLLLVADHFHQFPRFGDIGILGRVFLTTVFMKNMQIIDMRLHNPLPKPTMHNLVYYLRITKQNQIFADYYSQTPKRSKLTYVIYLREIEISYYLYGARIGQICMEQVINFGRKCVDISCASFCSQLHITKYLHRQRDSYLRAQLLESIQRECKQKHNEYYVLIGIFEVVAMSKLH